MKYYYPILAIKLHWLLTSWNSKQIVSDIFQSNIYNKFWEVNILSSVWRQKNTITVPPHQCIFISLRPSYCLFPHLTSREVLVYSLSCDLFETDTLNSPCDHTNLNLQHLLRLDKFELKMKIYWSKCSKTWGFRKNSIPFWHKSFFRKIGTVFL